MMIYTVADKAEINFKVGNDGTFVQKQFDEYQANRTEKEIVSEKTLRDTIIKDLSFVSKMGVAEYTLYQKYQEIHLKYPSQTVSTLYGEETNFVNEDHLKLITETKNNIWFLIHMKTLKN